MQLLSTTFYFKILHAWASEMVWTLSVSQYLPVFLKLLIFCVKMLRAVLHFHLTPPQSLPALKPTFLGKWIQQTLFKVLSINKSMAICIFCLLFLLRKPLFCSGKFNAVLRYSRGSVLHCLWLLPKRELRTLHRCSVRERLWITWKQKGSINTTATAVRQSNVWAFVILVINLASVQNQHV